MEQHKQGTEQWRRIRLGKMTSSKWFLFNVKNSADGSPSVGVKSYIMELLWELIEGKSNEVETYSMKWGKEWEPFAAKAIQDKYKSEYYADGFTQHPTLPYYGGSSDGYIEINGMGVTPEIKSPTGKEQLTNILLLKDVETCKKGWPEIYAQVQSNMSLQKTKMALAVTFHPHGGDNGYKDLMIPIDEAYIADKMAKMAEAWEWMKQQAKIFGIDILAKYAEYAKPVQQGTPLMTPSQEAEHFGTAA